ncbi:MAG: hypothetical protein WA830_07355 [Candidatus Sulfotelmatobacter sp.]
MPPTPSTPESVERAIANIERGLEALDSRGEQGLQDFLDQLYPGTQRTPLEYPKTDVTEGLTGDQPEIVSRDEEAAQTSAEHGPWDGEIPGTRVALGHGMYAFDLGGDVPMHIVAGPPMRTVKYQPGMEAELSQSSRTSADEAPAVEGPVAPRPVNSPEFRDAMFQELRAAHQAGAVKLAPGNEILPSAPNQINWEEFGPSVVKELRDYHAAVEWAKANPDKMPARKAQQQLQQAASIEGQGVPVAAVGTGPAQTAKPGAEPERPRSLGAMRSMRWNLLWYMPLVAPLLIILAILDGCQAYAQARVVAGYFTWALFFSPAAGIWFWSSIVSITAPITGLALIPRFFMPDPDLYRNRYRNTVLLILGSVVLVVLLWTIQWGCFPFDQDSNGAIRMRMIPFIPLPPSPF